MSSNILIYSHYKSSRKTTPLVIKDLCRITPSKQPFWGDRIRKSGQVKAVIRTGDFTAYSNILLVSGGGGRWYLEKP